MAIGGIASRVAATRKKFTSAANKSWLATTRHYKDLAVRARTGTWVGFKARLRKRFPEATDAELRELTQQRAKIAVDTFYGKF